MYDYPRPALFIHPSNIQFGHFPWDISIIVNFFFPSLLSHISMNLGIVMQWSESVDQEAVSSTKRSSRKSSRRLCLPFRLQQQAGSAKWPSAGTYAPKAAHLTRLLRARGSQMFQMGVACWLIKSTSASHLLTSSSMNFCAENGGEKMACNGVRHHTPVGRWTASTVGVLVPSITGALRCARGNSSLAYDVSYYLI